LQCCITWHSRLSRAPSQRSAQPARPRYALAEDSSCDPSVRQARARRATQSASGPLLWLLGQSPFLTLSCEAACNCLWPLPNRTQRPPPKPQPLLQAKQSRAELSAVPSPSNRECRWAGQQRMRVRTLNGSVCECGAVGMHLTCQVGAAK